MMHTLLAAGQLAASAAHDPLSKRQQVNPQQHFLADHSLIIATGLD
jgi:hypothetical protein